MHTIKPKPLPQNAVIGIVSPASPQRDPARLDRGIAYLEGLGYRVELGKNALQSYGGYLAVRSVLETVMDPEIGLSVIDLGLIREIHFLPNKTLVRMMLTTPFCPYAPQMMADVKNATESVVPQPCEVDMLPDAWSPDMMPDPSLLGFSY